MRAPLHRPLSGKHWLGLLLGVASALACLGLAWHYPLQPALAVLACLLLAGLAFVNWASLPLLLPALVPVLGFAPWTGWFSFEELDLAVLAVAAGAYIGWALQARAQQGLRAPVWQRSFRLAGLAKVLLVGFSASLVLSIYRGMVDAGGLRLDWWQGYHGPLNSLRQAKPLLLALLLLPLWQAALAWRPVDLQRRYGLAMMLALLTASLAALWERSAFPGLLNFSSDYRSTGLFWEMHVGGAALDGCLALTLPFALLACLRLRRPLPLAAALALAVLGGYAVLSSFSRGLYLGASLGAGLCVLLLLRQQRPWAKPQDRPQLARDWPLLLFTPIYIWAAWAVFGEGGYRGLLALLGSALLFYLLPPLRVRQTRAQKFSLLALALLAAGLAAALSVLLVELLPKVAYVICALVLGLGLGLVRHWRSGLMRQLHGCGLWALWLWSLACVAIVADHWHGGGALAEVSPPLLLWVLAWCVQQVQAPTTQSLTERGWRAKLLLWAAGIPAAALIAVLGGGAYLEERFASSSHDLQGRVRHWRESLALLESPQEWWLGKGVGRYAASQLLEGPPNGRIGDYATGESPGTSWLTLTGGRHFISSGEMLRISQRIAVPRGGLTLWLQVRSEQDVELQAEVCEKHLLYEGRCLVRGAAFKGRSGVWQPLQLPLGVTPAGMGGDWWAPRLVNFSIGVRSNGAQMDVTGLRLEDAGARALLANGDFAQGMARWFITSDRYHLPWHMKSMPLHVLFEQGLLGLLLWSCLLVAALWRCIFGHGREHVLAPALAGALLGFLLVGLFDSLIDAPRIGFLFYTLLILSLGVRALPPPTQPKP